jgi:membrane protease YdiL (CAAX protease family)
MNAEVTRSEEISTIHPAILLWSLTLFSVIPGTRRWPWVFLVPVLLYWALVQSFRPLRLTVGWLRMGHPTLPMWIAAATVAVGSAVSLLLWFKLVCPDVKSLAGLIPIWSPARLVLLGVGFALFNAAWEEMIWRGVVFDALERTRLSTGTVVLMQAVSFGVIHLHGFPVEASGYCLHQLTERYSVFCGHRHEAFSFLLSLMQPRIFRSSRYWSTLRITDFAYRIRPNQTISWPKMSVHFSNRDSSYGG